ncbi:hypothetical protein C0993_005422 [Termitomyces sp. T159_Od127]|nr:hypothetical protein C0993_005422 [Termitomyces sp. T159_Od127]
MRMCEPDTAIENVWHVLDVIEGSPAESAGLVPMGDWILGWSGGVLGAENDFYDLVEAHIDKPLRVYVYSYDFDALREVVLIPNRHWGGEGLLGCVFGFGLLHRIPPQPEDHLPGSVPLEIQEAEEDYEEQELFVPADVHSEVHYGHEQVQEWRRQEQEQWSQKTMARSHDDIHGTASDIHSEINTANGDITSMLFNGKQLQDSSKFTQLSSGLGSATVTSSVANNIAVIKITTSTIAHYYIVRSGINTLYIGTFASAEPSVGELRFIARLNKATLPNGNPNAEINGGTAIEGSDVFLVNGVTRSKFYSSIPFIRDQVHGVTGSGVAAYIIVPSVSYETSSGGPFFRGA